MFGKPSTKRNRVPKDNSKHIQQKVSFQFLNVISGSVIQVQTYHTIFAQFASKYWCSIKIEISRAIGRKLDTQGVLMP